MLNIILKQFGGLPYCDLVFRAPEVVFLVNTNFFSTAKNHPRAAFKAVTSSKDVEPQTVKKYQRLLLLCNSGKALLAI